jgi:hypothetical protein
MLFVGYSAGGNLLLKAIHAIGTVPRLTAVVTICQGYSIYLGGKHLRAVSHSLPGTTVCSPASPPSFPTVAAEPCTVSQRRCDRLPPERFPVAVALARRLSRSRFSECAAVACLVPRCTDWTECALLSRFTRLSAS